MAGILIVDDDPTIRAMFTRALKGLGEIQQAANGAEALRMLGAKRYGVVLLDLHMPMVDGFVLLHTLGSKPGPNHDTPIYVITADTSDQARLRALRRHAVFMLTKPVPLATLTSLVDATLKKAAARAASLAEGSEGLGGTEGEERPSATPAPATAKTPARAGRMTPPIRPVITGPPKKPEG